MCQPPVAENKNEEKTKEIEESIGRYSEIKGKYRINQKIFLSCPPENIKRLFMALLDANTPPPAANSRSEQNTNTGSVELWAL